MMRAILVSRLDASALNDYGVFRKLSEGDHAVSLHQCAMVAIHHRSNG
jgi:hypothetical protein